MNDSWIAVLEQKISQLELIASWASQVGYGNVRDDCRKAIYDLKYWIGGLNKACGVQNSVSTNSAKQTEDR